jgi:hypothetical protein
MVSQVAEKHQDQHVNIRLELTHALSNREKASKLQVCSTSGSECYPPINQIEQKRLTALLHCSAIIRYISVHIAEKYVGGCVFKKISQTLQSVKKNVFCILNQTGSTLTAGMLTYLHLYDEKSVPRARSYFHLTARCK